MLHLAQQQILPVSRLRCSTWPDDGSYAAQPWRKNVRPNRACAERLGSLLSQSGDDLLQNVSSCLLTYNTLDAQKTV